MSVYFLLFVFHAYSCSQWLFSSRVFHTKAFEHIQILCIPFKQRLFLTTRKLARGLPDMIATINVCKLDSKYCNVFASYRLMEQLVARGPISLVETSPRLISCGNSGDQKLACALTATRETKTWLALSRRGDVSETCWRLKKSLQEIEHV